MSEATTFIPPHVLKTAVLFLVFNRLDTTKQVFEAMWQGEGNADEIIQAKGLKQVSDSGALEKIVADVLDGNPAMVEDFINTDESKRKKKLGGFMGQIMKASKGQANPQQVNQILLQKLNALL